MGPAGSDWESAWLDGNAAYMLYFTSTDGVHWEKPNLGLMSLAGRRDHNIIFTSDMVNPTARPRATRSSSNPVQPMRPQGKKAFFWAVNKNPQPRDASEKFVALAIVQDHRRGAHIVTSPDGIRWSCADAPFWQTPNDVSGKGDDCLMHMFYDQAKQKWVIYRRVIPEVSERMIANESDRDRKAVDRYYRSYAYAESDDLRNWKNHRFILSMDPDDPPDTELYQFGCHKIGQTYLGYMSVFYLRDPQRVGDPPGHQPRWVELYPRLPRPAVHPLRPVGYYDYMAMACSQPEPIVVNDTVYIYYAAANFPHRRRREADRPGRAQGRGRRAGHFEARSLCVAGNGRSRRRAVPRGDQAVHVRHARLYLNAATWAERVRSASKS